MPQDKPQQAKTLLKEVEVYRSHCLFVEAKKRANELGALIRGDERIRNRERLLAALKSKIRQINEEAEAFEALALPTRLSAADKARIKQVFSSAFEEGTDASIYEAATAFMVFGQFKEAIEEFGKLIKSEGFRVTAIKNIFRCYIALSALKKAVALYLKLHASKTFPPAELERVRPFLHSVLKMKGVSRELPQPAAPLKLPAKDKSKKGPSQNAAQKPKPTPEEVVLEPSLDILSVVIAHPAPKGGEQEATLDVNIQRKNLISMIVPGNYEELLEYLKPGMRLQNLCLSSSDVIFTDNGVVHGKSEIRVGEKRGDYTVTIKLDSA